MNNSENTYERQSQRISYRFLFRPLFFIFSIIFSTWLVFFIEQLAPSDFGRLGRLFEGKPRPVAPVNVETQNEQQCLKRICYDYKTGLIDSVEMSARLDEFLKVRKESVPGN